jgi:hypothetical protein
MSDLNKQDWADWLHQPCTQAFLAHIDRDWGAGGVRFESTLNKFADSLEEDRKVLDQIRQIAVCRREILMLREWPKEEIKRLTQAEREPVGVSRRGTL